MVILLYNVAQNATGLPQVFNFPMRKNPHWRAARWAADNYHR